MRIKELRELHDMQQKTLANILGISSNTLSQYENEKREPGIDIVSKIAKYFNVSTDYVYGISEIVTCNDCGLSYCPNVELDIETHKEIHSKWKKAVEKHGFCYSYSAENERIKADNRNIVKNTSLSIDVRYDAQIEVFKCLFSRSVVASNYSDNHIDFSVYISMLLNQKTVEENLGEELYQKLVSEFGKKPGIPDGQTYYYGYEITQPTTLAAHFDGDEYTEDELDEIRQFAEFVKGKRK